MAGRVRLRVGNILTEAKETISLLGGAGISLSVNDETGGHDQAEVTITADGSPGNVQQALADHVAASDPHTQYQKESELNAASGYAGLDGSAKVAAANLPTLDAITAPAADVAMNSHKITGLATPTSGDDAVNKTYADATAAGLYPHDACTAATTANITLSGAQTIDGVSVVATNRVLVKDQTTTKDNGIYVAAAGAWSRSTDADTGAEIKGGSFVYILSGTANGGKGFAATHVGTPNLGTDPITFSQFSGTTGTPSGPAGGVLGGTYPNPTQGSLALTADLAAYQPTSGKGVSAGYPGAELTINAQTGTSYTLALTDSLKVVSMSNASANTVTVPPNASVAFPVGTRLVVKMTSTGQTTLVAGAGVTINTSAGTLALTGQYSYTTLVKTATNTWDAVGGLGAGSGSSGIPASTVTNKGDMLAASGVATVTNVAVGTDGKVLTADSTAGAGVSWQTPAAAGAGIPAATVTTKGDLIAATANATVARKPIGLDGTILTADASQATGMRWGFAVGGVFFTQTAGGGAGTATITVAQTPLAGFVSRGVLIVADAYTTNAEARYVTGVSGQQITVNSNWVVSHSGSNILLVHDLTVTPSMYGAKADGTTDDWQPVQNAILDATIAGVKVSGGNRIFSKYAVKQPVYLPETNFDHLWLVAPSDFTLDTSTNAEHCILMSARQVDAFTANATTDEITSAQTVAALGITADHEIAFSNPRGTTLPGNITSGRLYFVKTITGANTFTICATSGGTKLDITTNGTGGFLWTNMTSDIGFRGNLLRINNQKGNLNCMRVTCEQDSSIDTLYIDSASAGASVTDGSYCFKFHVAQYLNVRNMALVPGQNQQAFVCNSNGLNISDTLTINGPCSTGINMSGNHNVIAAYLMEGVGKTGGACIRLTGSARNIKFGPGYWSPPSDPTVPLFRDETSGSSTWEFDDVQTTLAGNAFLTDATRVGTLNTVGDFAGDPSPKIRHGGVGDSNFVVSGMKFVGDSDTGPIIKRRRSMRTRFADAASITTSPEIDVYLLDPTGGAQTVNLAGYGEGSRYTVKNGGTANSVTVSPGAASLDAGVVGAGTLTSGQVKTYVYMNGVWWVVG